MKEIDKNLITELVGKNEGITLEELKEYFPEGEERGDFFTALDKAMGYQFQAGRVRRDGPVEMQVDCVTGNRHFVLRNTPEEGSLKTIWNPAWLDPNPETESLTVKLQKLFGRAKKFKKL